MLGLKNLEEFKGKRALITGGSKGIGAAIAELFASVGIDCALIARHSQELNTMRAQIEKHQRRCWTIEADLSKVEEVKQAGERALSISDTWDIIVHSAGIASSAPLLEVNVEVWDQIQDVNVRSIVLLCQKIVPPMIKRKKGKIILISSLAGFVGTPGLGAYAVSKGGLNQLTRTMACEWGPHNIQVNGICPTIVLTEMGKAIWNDPARTKEKEDKLRRIPLHRFGKTEDVANLALFLASSGSDYMTGQSIPLEGGMLVAP